MKKAKIAIVGGGVAGASTTLYLGQLGLSVSLFEKESSLVSGPPFCHLHAGGNLYRDISDTQCISLLKQSIDFLRFYPFVVDFRPTVIALPTSDSSSPDALLPRLGLLQKEYQSLIDIDSQNRVLGDSQNYFKCYSKVEVQALKELPLSDKPSNCDEWMIPVAKHIDLDKIQYPLIMVQEYGLNLFRLSSGVAIGLQSIPSVTLHTQTQVTDIKASTQKFALTYNNLNGEYREEFDYLINASGFRSGKIDDILGIACKQMVEFKSAFVSHCDSYKNIAFPEIIFHGERGTPRGMGQFTPYPNGYFQLHGMTHDITLYKDGLVHNNPLNCQAKLGKEFIDKIEKSWTIEEVEERTTLAISHLSQFIPNFTKAKVASKPLFGAQQIPGSDPSLRVAEVSFPIPRYARCEIVKVSSVLDMIDAIVAKLIELGYADRADLGRRVFDNFPQISEAQIHNQAQSLSKQRDYPVDLASRGVDSLR